MKEDGLAGRGASDQTQDQRLDEGRVKGWWMRGQREKISDGTLDAEPERVPRGSDLKERRAR